MHKEVTAGLNAQGSDCGKIAQEWKQLQKCGVGKMQEKVTKSTAGDASGCAGGALKGT